MFAYLVTLKAAHQDGHLLADGDTAWHIATGRWILAQGAVPTHDPFSHSLPNAPWVAHEWLSELLLALTHQAGGWAAVVALTGFAFATAIGLLARSLAAHLPPVRVVLLAVVAILMTMEHLLARPHILALPVMIAWVAALVRAADSERAPSWWLLPLMTAWANLHGSFTLGLAMCAALGVEAVMVGWRSGDVGSTARKWAIFLMAATLAALVTPHGWRGISYTWEVMTQMKLALSVIGEWRSANFQQFQPLALWLLGALALMSYRGLRLQPIRLVVILGLVFMSLRHMRYIELVGLLVPLLAAAAMARQWGEPVATDRLGRWLDRHRTGSNLAAQSLGATAAVLLSLGAQAWRPAAPPAMSAPAAAVDAALASGVRGHVFNEYLWGGYLILRDVPVFIDGRADVYGEKLLRTFTEAHNLTDPTALDRLISRYDIGWTLLPVGTPAITLLDRLPGWKRIYADKTAVVHARIEYLPSR